MLEIGQKHNSNCQEMGETREPMAKDCVADALRIANEYAEVVHEDFWILFCAKPHVQHHHALVCGWNVSLIRPAAPILGMLVWKVDYNQGKMELDTTLSMPYDLPVDQRVLSTNDSEVTPTLVEVAKQSKVLLS